MSLDVEAANIPTVSKTTVRGRRKDSHERLVEAASEYPSGYPLYSFQLALGRDFKNFRRFKTVRMRMLLVKQNIIANLERKLKTADNEEIAELRLGCLDLDNNTERGNILRELDTALKDYGKPSPQKKRIQEQKDLVGPTITRKEKAYLDAEWTDLINIDEQEDSSVKRLLPYIDNLFVKLGKALSKASQVLSTQKGRSSLLTPRLGTKAPQEETRGAIYYTRPGARSIIRALVAVLTVIILLVPVVVLNFITSTGSKFAVIIIASSSFVGGVTMLSGASLAEIFVGGATYSAVLVVFVSQGGVSSG